MYKIMGIGDIAQCLLNRLLVLFLGGNTLGHVFGSECLGYCGHCTGSPRREHDDNAEEDGNDVILDLYIGACGVNQHLNAQNDQHHRGILYHAEHIDIRHKKIRASWMAPMATSIRPRLKVPTRRTLTGGLGGCFGRGLRGGFLAGILAGILGRFLRHRGILVKIVFHSESPFSLLSVESLSGYRAALFLFQMAAGYQAGCCAAPCPTLSFQFSFQICLLCRFSPGTGAGRRYRCGGHVCQSPAGGQKQSAAPLPQWTGLHR